MSRLGLWIPSWNRARFANRLLAQVDQQLEPHVEATLSLNPPSPDYEIPDRINVIRNETNIGQSWNILNGITSMTTDYLWMIGDDEQLLPGAIHEILELMTLNPGMIVCTDGVFDHGPEGFFDSWPAWMDACLDRGREVMLTAQTLMTATVFRRDRVNVDLAKSMIDTRYGHHFGMLDGLIDEPVVVTRQPVFVAGRASDSSIHVEPDDYKSSHGAVTFKALTDLISWVNNRTGRNYPASCYRPGVGFD